MLVSSIAIPIPMYSANNIYIGINSKCLSVMPPVIIIAIIIYDFSGYNFRIFILSSDR